MRSARRIAPRLPTHGVGKFAKVACARVRCSWVSSRRSSARCAKPARPLVAIVAGSKVSTKLTVLESLLTKVDKLIVGGGIANTFLAPPASTWQVAAGSRDARHGAQAAGAGRGARRGDPAADGRGRLRRNSRPRRIADVRSIHDVQPDEMILDIGPDTAERFGALLQTAGTIVWNGPVGVFEWDQFGEGTKAIAQAIAQEPGVFAGRRR